MSEIRTAGDLEKSVQAARAKTCAGFHDECTNLMHSVMESSDQSAERSLSPEALAWAKRYFADLKPTTDMLRACSDLQSQERQFDPSYRLEEDDPVFLREDIALLTAERFRKDRNQVTTGQVQDGVPDKVPAEAGRESKLLIAERDLQKDTNDLTAVNETALKQKQFKEIEDRSEKVKTTELRLLQSKFDTLKVQGVGTVEALRQVIGATDNPETQQYLNAILQRVHLLQTALPDKPKVVTRLLNRTGLNLAAATVAGSFAEFITAAENETILTEIDEQTLRQIINRDDQYLRTGSEVRNKATESVVDPNTGNTVPLYTVDNKAKVRKGVHVYTETGNNVLLELNHGSLHKTLDVTGLDGTSLGIVAEVFALAATAHENGADGFIKHLYGVDLKTFDNRFLDPITLHSIQNKLTWLLATGHDGQILDPDGQERLIRFQMQAVYPTANLMPWENDPDGYMRRIKEMGLGEDDNLEEFGSFCRLNFDQG